MKERFGSETELVRISNRFGAVVVQPTSLCNADCEYCYLPHRKLNNVMSVEVAGAVATSIREQGFEQPVTLIWHGGEPLVTPREHFRKLLGCFEDLRREGRVTHNIQTNATLINDEWCQLFIEFGFKVGISLDGPPWANVQRVDWAGRPIYNHIMRGVEALRRNDIPFSVIAVINSKSIARGKELYEFFADLGCYNLGFNIEEKEGVNTGTVRYVDDDRVQKFWSDILDAWKDNPVIRVREINYTLGYINALANEAGDHEIKRLPIDPFPTVACNGDVVLLSPELAGIKPTGYDTFVAGNVLHTSLPKIIENRDSHNYVRDYIRGAQQCSEKCGYFEFCGGGQVSNKYFEHGRIDVTETAFCRNSKQRLMDAVLAKL